MLFIESIRYKTDYIYIVWVRFEGNEAAIHPLNKILTNLGT